MQGQARPDCGTRRRGSRWRGEGAGSGATVSQGNWILSWCGTVWEPGLTNTEGAPQGLGLLSQEGGWASDASGEKA